VPDRAVFQLLKRMQSQLSAAAPRITPAGHRLHQAGATSKCYGDHKGVLHPTWADMRPAAHNAIAKRHRRGRRLTPTAAAFRARTGCTAQR